jgi:hypothetical protein
VKAILLPSGEIEGYRSQRASVCENAYTYEKISKRIRADLFMENILMCNLIKECTKIYRK